MAQRHTQQLGRILPRVSVWKREFLLNPECCSCPATQAILAAVVHSNGISCTAVLLRSTAPDVGSSNPQAHLVVGEKERCRVCDFVDDANLCPIRRAANSTPPPLLNARLRIRAAARGMGVTMAFRRHFASICGFTRIIACAWKVLRRSIEPQAARLPGIARRLVAKAFGRKAARDIRELDRC